MKELEKLNILRVNKTDHNMFYFFIQTLQFNFNFENCHFKKVFSFSFYTIQVCQGLLIGIYCQRFVAPNLYKGERMTVDLSRYTSSRLHSLLSNNFIFPIFFIFRLIPWHPGVKNIQKKEKPKISQSSSY